MGHGIDKQVLELILRRINTRLAMDATGTFVRAIQGHSLLRFNIDELYTEIKALDDFRADPVWRGKEPRDHLVLEISHESMLTNWARVRTLPPTTALRWHTMKAVSGTDKQDYGSKNVVLYVLITVEQVYAHQLKIDLFKIDDGRIVTKCSILASLVRKARRHTPQGTEIYQPMMVPAVPAAPVGEPRIRSRRGTPPPMGSNIADHPEPIGTYYYYQGRQRAKDWVRYDA